MGAPVERDHGVRPKRGLTVTAVYALHRDALEYDFRARFGFGVEKIDREELSWQETVALIGGLIDDHTSHTFASVTGWAYVPSPEEVAFYDDLDVRIAMNRGKHQPMPQPVKRPWEQAKVREVLPRNDAETVKRRHALNERLGIA